MFSSTANRSRLRNNCQLGFEHLANGNVTHKSDSLIRLLQDEHKADGLQSVAVRPSVQRQRNAQQMKSRQQRADRRERTTVRTITATAALLPRCDVVVAAVAGMAVMLRIVVLIIDAPVMHIVNGQPEHGGRMETALPGVHNRGRPPMLTDAAALQNGPHDARKQPVNGGQTGACPQQLIAMGLAVDGGDGIAAAANANVVMMVMAFHRPQANSGFGLRKLRQIGTIRIAAICYCLRNMERGKEKSQP